MPTTYRDPHVQRSRKPVRLTTSGFCISIHDVARQPHADLGASTKEPLEIKRIYVVVNLGLTSGVERDGGMANF
jgi:hypothetical protein